MNYIEYKYEKLMELDKFYELVEANNSKLNKFTHNVDIELCDKECLKHCLLDIHDILLLARILKNCRKNKMFNESDILRNKTVNMGNNPIKVCYEFNNEVSIYGSTDRYKCFNIKTKEDLINLNHKYGKDEDYPISVYELNIYGEPILIGEWRINKCL